MLDIKINIFNSGRMRDVKICNKCTPQHMTRCPFMCTSWKTWYTDLKDNFSDKYEFRIRFC